MIKQVELTRFKKYKSKTFCLHPQGVTLLVGGNNAGKSTLIQALSVWEFCKMVLLHEKGREVFNRGEWGNSEGFGMSAEEFLPIAVPSLNHLWTNLKTQLSPAEKQQWADDYPGYIMRIKCIWDYHEQHDRMLEIGLSLVNDRLFLRITDSNLNNGDHLMSAVYLPTFAGVLPKENKATIAERRAFLGRGMAGSIIRNMVYDLYAEEKLIHDGLIKDKSRLSAHDRALLAEKSPLRKLQNNLRATFYSQLEIEPFSEDFHTVLKINERKEKKSNLAGGGYEVLPKNQYSPRDIITQGSGYLQWLSIFCLLYSSGVDVLLLDEPDAHLHASLQSELLARLIDATSGESEKQILVSTHSVEIIKRAPLEIVYSMEQYRYLSAEQSRVAVLAGIGSEYFPRIELLQQYRRLIFVENESDKKILSILGDICGIPLPKEVVFWPTTDTHDIRRHLFESLQSIIPGLMCISLRDRDMEEVKVVGRKLEYKSISLPQNSPIRLLQWRRKNIESYLLCPNAIARASGKRVNEIKTHLMEKFLLATPDAGCVQPNPPEVILLCDGKHIFTDGENGLERVFSCNKYDVAKRMIDSEIPEDIKIFLKQVKLLFNS